MSGIIFMFYSCGVWWSLSGSADPSWTVDGCHDDTSCFFATQQLVNILRKQHKKEILSAENDQICQQQKNLKLHKFTSQYLSQLFYYFKHIVIVEASRLRICKYLNFPMFFLVTVTVFFLVTVCEKWGVSKVDGKVDDGVDDRHFLWKESAPFISNGEQSKLPTPLSLSSPLSLTDPLSSIWHFRHEALDNDNGDVDNDHQQQWPQQ